MEDVKNLEDEFLDDVILLGESMLLCARDADEANQKEYKTTGEIEKSSVEKEAVKELTEQEAEEILKGLALSCKDTSKITVHMPDGKTQSFEPNELAGCGKTHSFLKMNSEKSLLVQI